MSPRRIPPRRMPLSTTCCGRTSPLRSRGSIATAHPTLRPYPTAAELTDLEYQLDLGGASERWDRIWTEIKAG